MLHTTYYILLDSNYLCTLLLLQTKANLARADFSNSIIREASFEGADLTGANFEGATGLGTAIFHDAFGLASAVLPVEYKSLVG